MVKDMSSPHLELINWTLPPDGWVKLNSDGSVAAELKASCGGILRGSSGEFLGGFVANLRICPIIVRELWGTYHVLLIAWNKGFRQVLLELDSSSAVALIHKECIDHHPFASVIKHVRHLLQRNWVVKI